MIGLIDASEYYQLLRRDPALERNYEFGLFCYAPSLHMPNKGYDKVLRYKYRESLIGHEYNIAKVDLKTEFESLGDTNYELHIRSNERALVIGAKYRPVIIVSIPVASWTDGTRSSNEFFLTAPVYSFAGDETKLSYSPKFIAQVKGGCFPQLFYLPESPQIREGYVGFDRIQSVRKDLLEQMPVQLTDDALYLFRDWLRFYQGEDLLTINDVLFDNRRRAMTALGFGA